MSELRSSPALSLRGQTLVETSAKSTQTHYTMRDTYHAERNTKGSVTIGIAENTLMHEELRQYFQQNLRLVPLDFTYGDGWTGSVRLSGALSEFINSKFNPHMPVLPDNLLLGAGVTTLMTELSQVVANPGEGILLAAPYYYGFHAAFAVQGGIHTVGVPIPSSEMFTVAELTRLERGLQESNAKGTTIRAVVLCNPHNPLGRCYPPDVILAYCHFCEKHNLHLFSDEIYALSTFPSRDNLLPQPFISVLSIDLESQGVNPARVHVLYGMSKDFNANGFRVGAIVTRSDLIISGLMTKMEFMVVASPADALWSALLTDKSYLPSFLNTNRLRLRGAYEYMTSWLHFHKIPYTPSSAGHFLMVDFRPVLSNFDRYGALLSIAEAHSMQERESALCAHFLKHGVVVMAGTACGVVEGGWFRLTFAVRRDYMDLALSRIERVLGWDGWPGDTKD